MWTARHTRTSRVSAAIAWPSRLSVRKTRCRAQHRSNEICKSQFLMHDMAFANAGLPAKEGVKIAFQTLGTIWEVRNLITLAWPQPERARRRVGICFVAAPRRCTPTSPA